MTRREYIMRLKDKLKSKFYYGHRQVKNSIRR